MIYTSASTLLNTLQAKALVDPFAYDEYREKQKKEKMELKQASRITVLFILIILFCTYIC